MKGMSFGEGTGYKSPQLMKKEAAMKMKREAAMKLKQRDGSTPGTRDVSTKTKTRDPKDVHQRQGSKERAKTRQGVTATKSLMEGSGGPFDKSDVGKHQGYDDKAGIDAATKNQSKYQKEFMDSDAGKKQFNTEIKGYMADGMSEKDAIAKAQKDFTKREKAYTRKYQDRDYAYGRDKNLSNLVKERDRLKAAGDTSSPEYQAIQNRINQSYGSQKRHGQTTETTEKKGGRVTETTTTTPGIGTTTTKTKKNKKGETTKVKETQKQDEYYGGAKDKVKLKGDKVDNAKFTEKGNLSAETGETSKTKRQKQFRDTKFGQTKVGQFFVKKDRRGKR